MNDFYCSVALQADAKIDIVYEDSTVLAFRHTKPFWRHHIVAIPKQHIQSLSSTSPDELTILDGVWRVAGRLAVALQNETGSAAITTHLGSYQDSQHVHLHIHSGAREKARE